MAATAASHVDEGPDEGLHPWVVKARAIDMTAGGRDLDSDTLARYVRIVRVARSAGAPTDPLPRA